MKLLPATEKLSSKVGSLLLFPVPKSKPTYEKLSTAVIYLEQRLKAEKQKTGPNQWLVTILAQKVAEGKRKLKNGAYCDNPFEYPPTV